MALRVNELFLSLQGEGIYAGSAAFFVRLAGCNLRCPFCDTRHEPYTLMAERAIADEAVASGAKIAVVTGGEPALQLTSALVAMLHARGMRVHVETNGTVPFLTGVERTLDWITCSPKEGRMPVIGRIDELKVLFGGDPADVEKYEGVEARYRSVQPLDTGDTARNAAVTRGAVEWVMRHPGWRLSLQVHKLIDIP